MTMSEDQPGNEESTTPATGPEDLDPTTEATPKKRLASGREATARASAGQSLGDVGGVATHRPDR